MIIGRLSDLYPRYLIYFASFLYALCVLVFSVHWIIVFIGLCLWRPRHRRDEEQGIEMTAYVDRDSALEVQQRNEATNAYSTGSDQATSIRQLLEIIAGNISFGQR